MEEEGLGQAPNQSAIDETEPFQSFPLMAFGT